MTSKTKILIGSTIFVLALVIGLFFTFFESYETTVDLGWSEEAKLNRFLAAQQYLDKLEITHQISSSFKQLKNLESIDTLIINNDKDVVSVQQQEELLNWIRSGGHLIIAFSDIEDEYDQDHFLRTLGFDAYTREYSDDDESQTWIDENQDFSENVLAASKKKSRKNLMKKVLEKENSITELLVTTLTFDGIEGEVDAYFETSTLLDHDYFYQDEQSDYAYQPFYWQGDNNGTRFIQMEIEEGLVTVMSTVEIWNNYNIDILDHALLLRVLTKYSTLVVFLEGSSFPHLNTLIWKYAYELVISLLIIIIVWLIFKSRRFVPAIQTATSQRRSLLEHIQAIGNYHWRLKQTDTLVLSLRTQILQKVKNLNPEINIDKDTNSCINWLAKRCNLQPSLIENAIYAQNIASELDFINITQTLQLIKTELSI